MIFNHPFFHFRPREVPEHAGRLNHTFGFGGAALVLMVLLFGSGILLRFVYDPFPGGAYDSILALQANLRFGRLVRNIHHWSANLLVIVGLLHLMRVFFSGGFYPPRQLNWIFGLLLLVSCLASSFTGYLLPWDQLSYWAVTICTGMLGYIPFIGATLQQVIQGGEQIGAATLRIFYTLHTAVLPALLILLAVLHFWYIRMAGGVVVPRRPGERSAPPENRIGGETLLLKEAVASLVVIAVILVAAALIDAPLGEKANPGLSPNPAKAPWYFAGLQELLLLFHPVVSILVVPLSGFAAMIALPYVSRTTELAGVWFRSCRGRRLAVVSLVLSLVVTPACIAILELTALSQDAGGSGIIPAAGAFAGIVLYYRIIRRRGSGRDEAIQAVFICLLVSYLVLTISGIWFRGAGMALTWPWSLP